MILAHPRIDTVDPEYQLLRELMSLESNKAGVSLVAEKLGANQFDGPRLISLAEHNGVAPIVYRTLKDFELQVDETIARQLKALSFRHVQANRIRSKVLARLVRKFDQAGLTAIVLKGAALSHQIYPDIGLRPMRDIDILASDEQIGEICRQMQDAGFHENSSSYSKFNRYDHHHIPPFNKRHQGLNICIEIHRDALDRDTLDSLTVSNLTAPPVQFPIQGYQANTLAPSDMLHHLCRHSFEPARHFKLIQAVDITRYLMVHREHLDWPAINRYYPGLENSLAMVDLLCPFPETLDKLKFRGDETKIRGIGIPMLPLSQISSYRSSFRLLASELLCVSTWWLYGYYRRPINYSVFILRYVVHLGRLVIWFVRRTRNRIMYRFNYE